MTAKEYLLFLKNEIHSTVFATVDKNGLPQTCVIDIMLCDEDSLYFLTAKGKAFYDRLTAQSYVAISGMRGKDTMSTDSISLRGKGHEEATGTAKITPAYNFPCDYVLHTVGPIITGKLTAAKIAVKTVKEFLSTNTTIKKVIFNVFKEVDHTIYRELLGAD